MTEITRRELTPGAFLTAVRTSKFKSSYVAANFLTPLRGETAAENALIPMVLRRGSERHPDMGALSAALDELYGGAIVPSVRKKGESQCVGFVGGFLDDGCAPGGEPILENAIQMLGELLLSPAVEDGGFLTAYVEGERDKLISRIRAQRNDKRLYAMGRLMELMCAGEPYGVDKLGGEAQAEAITPASLWGRYRALLESARLELYFCGSAETNRVEEAFRQAFSKLERCGKKGFSLPVREVRAHRTGEEARCFEEKMDVTQGKLCLGLRTGGVTVRDEDYPAMLLLNAAFGGAVTSRLFLNVREKLSLCYYAVSHFDALKGLITVSSGVEFGKREKAQAEILSQLECCCRGELKEEELENARRSLTSELYSSEDSQGRTEDRMLTQAAADHFETPEELIQRLDKVTPEQVTAAANRLELDGVYFLTGREAQG